MTICPHCNYNAAIGLTDGTEAVCGRCCRVFVASSPLPDPPRELDPAPEDRWRGLAPALKVCLLLLGICAPECWALLGAWWVAEMLLRHRPP